MPLTQRGREVLERLPQATFGTGSTFGCEIVRHDELCVGCGKCAVVCPSGACRRGDLFDVSQLLGAPCDSRRGALGAALRRIQRRPPDDPIEVPARITTYRTIEYEATTCLGCGACARVCPVEAIEALAPKAEPAPPQPASPATSTGVTP